MGRRRADDMFSMNHFMRVARGMKLSDPLGLDEIVAKHHGDDAVLDLFVTDMFGVPMLDDEGVAIRRTEFPDEYEDQSDDEDDVPF